MSDLDERLRNALHDFDARVAVSVRSGFEPSLPQLRTRPTRPRRFLVPVLAAVAVLAVVVGSLLIGTTKDRAVPAVPTPAVTQTPDLNLPTDDAPSQSPQDAQRDGVYPAVAQQSLTSRMATVYGPMQWIGTPEGVWVLTRPQIDRSLFQKNHCLERNDDTPQYPLCTTAVYNELLLLSPGPQEAHIIRAYPLLNAEDWFEITQDAVYCGHDSDRSHFDSSVCRVDRTTLELEGLWLTCGSEGICPKLGGSSPQMSRRPGTWTYGPYVYGAAGTEVNAKGQVTLVDRYGRDTATLGADPFRVVATAN